MTERVQVKYLEKNLFEVKAEESATTIYADRRDLGTIPKGPAPAELFLAGLATCAGVYAKMYMARHSIMFKKLEIQAAADVDLQPPARLVNIQLTVYTDARLDRLEPFERAVKSCLIHNTIINTKEIQTKFIVPSFEA